MGELLTTDNKKGAAGALPHPHIYSDYRRFLSTWW